MMTAGVMIPANEASTVLKWHHGIISLTGQQLLTSEQGFSAVRNRLLGHLTTNPLK